MFRLCLLLASLSLPPVSALAAPLYNVPEPSAEQLQSVYEFTRGPRKIGYVQSLQLDSSVDGIWEDKGEQSIWSATIFAANARALSLQFSEVRLPTEAHLEISAKATNTVLRYDATDVHNGHLYSTQLPSNTLDLRLSVPISQAAHLKLNKANVAYTTLTAKSGGCNIDTACPVAQTHNEKVRSTVLLIYPIGQNVFACTGFLVNNEREDLTPYLLTADHCEIDASNDENVEVYWQYEDAICDGSNNNSPDPPNAALAKIGTTFLADDVSSDFTLLLLGTRANPFVPPANFDPYWSGWNVGTSAATSGVSVHHPKGDQKAISIFDSPASATNVNISGRNTEAWKVFWEQGTTEQGSSGSGLWNESSQVVGVLSGGEASCGNQSGADYYGRLNEAWAPSTDCDSSLKYWLDPEQTGTLQLAGADLISAMAQPNVPACPPAPTPSPTATASPTPSPSASPSPTPDPTASPPASPTPSPAPSPSSSPVATSTPAASPTPTASAEPTSTPESSPTPSPGNNPPRDQVVTFGQQSIAFMSFGLRNPRASQVKLPDFHIPIEIGITFFDAVGTARLIHDLNGNQRADNAEPILASDSVFSENSLNFVFASPLTFAANSQQRFVVLIDMRAEDVQ